MAWNTEVRFPAHEQHFHDTCARATLRIEAIAARPSCGRDYTEDVVSDL